MIVLVNVMVMQQLIVVRLVVELVVVEVLQVLIVVNMIVYQYVMVVQKETVMVFVMEMLT
tara:strand:+ start:159 stop:338 length:180 start_codon:yes stop_codon:yes gene_type:complete